MSEYENLTREDIKKVVEDVFREELQEGINKISQIDAEERKKFARVFRIMTVGEYNKKVMKKFKQKKSKQ